MITEIIDGVALIHIDSPPVNSLSHRVRLGLFEALHRANEQETVRAIVLHGRGRGFSAGGDIHEMGTAAATAWPQLSLDLHPVIENSRRPVIAAVHGITFGGGFETVLACHYRVAHAEAVLAMPEITLGLIPLSGTQRLPRLMEVEAAVDFILRGERVRAADFGGAMFDEIVTGAPDDVVSAALAFARRLNPNDLHRLVRERPIFGTAPEQSLQRAYANWRDRTRSAAQQGALDAIAAAVTAPDFAAGLQRARDIYGTLQDSAGARAGRDSFLSSRVRDGGEMQ